MSFFQTCILITLSHSDKKILKYHGYSWLTEFFFLFLIDRARLYPFEWSSVSLGAKMLLNIVLDSFLRKCQEMAVAYSVLFFVRYFYCWNSLYEPYIQPGIIVQWTSTFLIVYALLIWQGISCATPWKWNFLVHWTLFLSECSKSTSSMILDFPAQNKWNSTNQFSNSKQYNLVHVTNLWELGAAQNCLHSPLILKYYLSR